MTGTQYRIMVDTMPEAWARWHLQVAQLEATIRNMMGGKRPPKKEPGGDPPLEPHELYTAEELLVYFARLERPEAWTPAALADAKRNQKRLPAWALKLIPWEQLA
jgi:hypothetical protein